jgi:1,4-alpha-glucan branching enzyme
MITKIAAGRGKVRVTFCIPAAIWADTVHVVGSFNDWSKTQHPLQLDDSGWHITIELDAGKNYEYRYLINSDEWHNDWHADRYVPNEYGGDNSVVDLTGYGCDDDVAEDADPSVVDVPQPRIVELARHRAVGQAQRRRA